MIKNSEDDLSVTRTNGILLVILGLAWWGSHITEEIRQNPEPRSWINAVQDVTERLTMLADDVAEPIDPVEMKK